MNGDTTREMNTSLVKNENREWKTTKISRVQSHHQIIGYHFRTIYIYISNIYTYTYPLNYPVTKLIKKYKNSRNYFTLGLTEVAGEGGPDLAPQKFLLSQQFRYLMR